MSGKTFIDTNILVYAHNRDALTKNEVAQKLMISFRDSMIVAAAHRAGAERIVTEELNHGQYIEGILIENPFC